MIQQTNKLDEIFKSNTRLLEEPEVKELINYFQDKYGKLYKSYKKLDDLEFKILDRCMHSEVILKEGKSSKETLISILELLNK